MRKRLFTPLRFTFAIILSICVLSVSSRVIRQLKDNRKGDSAEKTRETKFNEEELSAEFWNSVAQEKLIKQLTRTCTMKKAKNVIFFIGDGMSVPTVTASRIHAGQKDGRTGEEHVLFMETLPHVGFSRTYCVDATVPESGCSATACLTGVKANSRTIGVTAAVKEGDCKSMTNSSLHTKSVLHYAQEAGKLTGIVTTTRVTHATPAATYAHTAQRDWESDKDVKKGNADPQKCEDIAKQLVMNEPGKNINVILGGGLKKFITKKDGGSRRDGIDLVEEWRKDKKRKKFVQTTKELFSVKAKKTDFLLGLFSESQMEYRHNAHPDDQPSLEEMTSVAIEFLRKGPKGYFLFVEGGRIDHGHHTGRAFLAVEETLEFDKAIKVALDRTSEKDTLIIVTSDHDHTMSISGYSKRGDPIFGIASGNAADQLPYTIISYANGPGYKQPQKNGSRYNINDDDTLSPNYKQPALVPLALETHGGADVSIYSRGPHSHLFVGSIEQNVIAHIINYAACLGPGRRFCDENVKSDEADCS